MFKPFRTAAVLGAGVMGTQIAAHLANVGLTVHLLDIPDKGDNKNKIVETAFKKALKQTPPIFFTEKTARRVILGNFDEHFNRIANVDWVIEAVIENLDIKQQLMKRVEGVINDQALISSNTSGLPIQAIAQGRSDSFRSRFMGVHFFNPPRYLKLLELIPTEDTHPHVLKRMQWFGRLHLGKGVVVAKDTPNFIANRIGVYVSMLGIDAFINQGYAIEEIDALTGTLAGRPKSGTFRTADLVGLDTLMYVADNLYPVIPHDESRERFQVPELLRKLVETGKLGAKTRQGFYKKVDQQILSLNPKTLAYEPANPLKLGNIDAIKQIKDLPERLRALYQDPGRAGAFFRQSILKTLSYSACRIPEIADNPADIDRAMRWGFGWELGPFEIWDALGFETVLSDMKAADIAMPDWLEKMRQTGAAGFYWNGHGVYGPVGQVYELMTTCPDEIKLSAMKSAPQRTLWQNPEAALLDLGDGVVLFEFRSKGNTLSTTVLEGLTEVLDSLEEDDYRGLVIGNDGAHFSMGANLAEMGALVMKDRFNPFTKRSESAIAHIIVQFHALMQRIHYFPKPIVAAVQRRTLGGGCELAMACPQVVAAAESYIGLVELGVGLIPGAGGIMRMAAIAAERAATDTPQHILPFLKLAFETIAMAKVANSAYEAQELGFLSPSAQIVINADRRLYVAKEEVLRLDREGYYPPAERNAIRVLGRPARTLFEHAAYIMLQGGFISEYDRFLANRLAYVITGGDLTAPALVHEDYLLQLEREAFLPLLHQKKTQERVMHLLKTKKPLRN